MLKGIDPLLNGPLLDALDRLGHGQELAVVDGNYPAYTPGATVIRLAAGLVPTLRAILTVFPLESSVPIARMQVDVGPDRPHPQMVAALALADEGQGVDSVPRKDFYARVGSVAVVVLTSEMEPYANVVLTKGVVAAPA